MAFKKTVWLNGNKMLIESGHKTFDRQTNIITHGNAVANTEFGSYVRPSSELECNGFMNAHGHLQDYDLKPFEQFGLTGKSWMWEEIVKRIDASYGGILYAFFHRLDHVQLSTNGNLLVHGFALTDKKHGYLWSVTVGRTAKSTRVLEECLKYVCDGYRQ